MSPMPFLETEKRIAVLQDEIVSNRQDFLVIFWEAVFEVIQHSRFLGDLVGLTDRSHQRIFALC